MIKAGMSIDEALEILIENASPVMAKKLRQVLIDIKAGNSLSSAFRKHKHDFDELFINMIDAGERGGTLVKNLALLSIQNRKRYDLNHKIRAAAMYPVLVLLAVAGLLVTVAIFVLPKIIGFFNSLNVDLPITTRLLISSSTFFIAHWKWIILVIIVLIILLRMAARFAATRFWLHLLILKLPLFGKISRNINLALFSRTLASLLNSGITIDQALQIVSRTVTNDVYKKQISIVYHNIIKGSSLTSNLNNRKYFPSLVAKMTKVGEKSGNLSETLDYLADFYETEVDDVTKNLSTILEPALLILIGLIVGFVALSIINPIYDLTSKVGR